MMSLKSTEGCKPKKKLYLHIGYGKTGSTYLQKLLLDNKALLKKNHCLYPTNGMHENYSHNKFFLSVIKGNAYFPFDVLKVKRYLEEISQSMNSDEYDSVIISSECAPYILRNLDKYPVFSDFFEQFDVHTLCYLRNATDFIESIYKQFVKDGNVPFTEDFDTFFEKKHHICNFDWLHNVESIFGPNSLTVLNYDECKVNLSHSFLRFIGLDGMELEDARVKKKQVNKSFGMIESELIRLQRKYGISKDLFKEFYKAEAFESLRYITEEKEIFLKQKYDYEKLFEAYRFKGDDTL